VCISFAISFFTPGFGVASFEAVVPPNT
jgi:hypothetical protein